MRRFRLALVLGLMLLSFGPAEASVSPKDAVDDLLFIHHSSGANWLAGGLRNALLAKDYIHGQNEIYYGTVVPPDPGRPRSQGNVPGDNTNMNHWILWFNDYLSAIKSQGATAGTNRIIMFKSCFPISGVGSVGSEPGDPFSADQTLANYKALYRHPAGPGNVYTRNGITYRPLEDIFAANPDRLFIPVTAPPLDYGATNDADARRARQFNNWLKNEWLKSYNAAHPGLNNVAVFDWFDVLANPDDALSYPNRLKASYGGQSGDSHPNAAANAYSTKLFASDPDNFLDRTWSAFKSGTAQPAPPPKPVPVVSSPFRFQLGFKALADQVPSVVGEPLESEQWGANGDSLQQTTTGLMVWRKSDNWTAFTNGSRSWINGPYGVQERSNGERFEWEK